MRHTQTINDKNLVDTGFTRIDTIFMQAVIDDQGRVEIPLELRDRLHLTAGVIVEFQTVDQGLQIKPASFSPSKNATEAKLVWEDGLLVIHTPDVITIEDVNNALELGRQERMDRIMGIETTDK
jgi:AbrB family looped-hinge helix DNA binding protein